MAAALSGLSAAESRWIDYIRENVVGLLEGSAADRARTAAIVTWWSLKEGVLDVRPSPWRHNLCSTGKLGDLQTCPQRVWQLGMSGIQPSAVAEVQVDAVAARIYPGMSDRALLAKIASDAGVDASTAAAIEDSSGDLRKAWLLRDPAISFTMQAPFVQAQCLRGGDSASWCFGGWDTARRFASSPHRIEQVIASLEDHFSDAPSISRGRSTAEKVGIALAAGALTWWALYQTQAGSRFRRKYLP